MPSVEIKRPIPCYEVWEWKVDPTVTNPGNGVRRQMETWLNKKASEGARVVSMLPLRDGYEFKTLITLEYVK